MSTGTVVIQAVNTGPIAITVTDALVVNYLGQTPVRYCRFSDANRSIATGDVHFFVIGPTAPQQLGLDPSVPVSWNATQLQSFETISLISQRSNVFQAKQGP